MRIFVKARPKSKKEYIKREGEGSFIVAVKEVSEKGKANQAIIKALAEFFNIPISSIVLVSGQTFKQKVFEIPLSLRDLEKTYDLTLF
ncbi:DUF167 domain-containing protein [Candidatus Daviesbacteria bacterium]|nr:DUF167 domain-containing protein [Candidatus Daviesbacteria bacterium]